MAATQPQRKRLIEVAFPLEEVSAHSRREKKVHHGHISSLHIWWARRPLAACRAFIYASLVADPGNDADREELLREVADLASWDAVRHSDKIVRVKACGGSGLTGTELLERARRRILDDNSGKPPRLLDPFAGGGAIPLEGLRLGCEVEANDLNPVAVLILKGTVEYPQKYGQPDSRPVPDYIHQAAKDSSQARFNDEDLTDAYRRNPLAADVRYWGRWVVEKAKKELAEFYPPDQDGSVPVAYLWSRTVPCPSCDAEMPLMRQYWLARKDKKKVALEPVIDRENQRVDFKVVTDHNIIGDPAEATTSRGDTRCLLCGQVLKGVDVRKLSSEGKMSSVMTAVVLRGVNNHGKRYRSPTPRDLVACEAATERLELLRALHRDDLSLVPDEPIDPKTLGLRVDAFGFDQWGKLFSNRQSLTLTTFARLVSTAHVEMARKGLDPDYAKAVATYLALAVSRYSDFACTLSKWKVDAESVVGALAMQTLPMVWDYAEQAPLPGAGGSFWAMVNRVVSGMETAIVAKSGAVTRQQDARSERADLFDCVLTDPPYYDAIDYAGLSDFFYVWIKRSLLGVGEENLLRLPLTPKSQQAIMASEAGDPIERKRYVSMMGETFRSIANSLEPSGLADIVFAHANSDAWATLIQGLLENGLVPNSSWPIDTEAETKVSRIGQARLSTSVWMACRKREEAAGEAFLGDVLAELRPVVRERLLYFWSKGIRGADFFISAIGPALSVFGRYEQVLRPDGTTVSVRDFLDIVRRESTDVALEQVLQGADLGVIDTVTRQYVTWVWSYSRAPLDAGEAIALCLATGASYAETSRPASIAAEGREKSKKVVRLRTVRQRASEDDDLGFGTAARPSPLIDQLQYAAWLWGQNRTGTLGGYRGSLGEPRWEALRTLGQAVAECLPDGDEDRRIINGLLGSGVMAVASPSNGRPEPPPPAVAQLPGFETEE